jgi:hypothetical protein
VLVARTRAGIAAVLNTPGIFVLPSTPALLAGPASVVFECQPTCVRVLPSSGGILLKGVTLRGGSPAVQVVQEATLLATNMRFVAGAPSLRIEPGGNAVLDGCTLRDCARAGGNGGAIDISRGTLELKA